MALALVNIGCSIEMFCYDNEGIGISLDLTDSIEQGIVAIDALEEQKINHFDFVDPLNKHRITVSVCGANANQSNNGLWLEFGEEQLKTLKNLMLDVFLNQGFDGYHYDLELSNRKGLIDISFLLQRGITKYD